MDERYLNIYGEILYNNSAVVDDWYLALFGAGWVEIKPVTFLADFECEIEYSLENITEWHNLLSFDNARFTTSNATTPELRIDTSTINSLAVVDLSTPLLASVAVIKRVSGVVTVISGVNQSSGVFSNTMILRQIGMDFSGIGGGDGLKGAVLSVKAWNDGNRTTGTKVLDYNFQSLSNVIVNQATTPSANLWAGSTAVATGESSVIDTETINVLSTGVNSQVSVAETLAGQDVLVQVTVESGDLDNIICGDLTTEFTGWTNILDSFKQPVPKRFQTLTNNDLDFIVFKTNGAADVTLTNITAQTVDGYGVLNGTRNTDYKYKNDSPHAIGYNITTTEDPECPLSDLFAGGVLQSNGTLQDGTILGQP